MRTKKQIKAAGLIRFGVTDVKEGGVIVAIFRKADEPDREVEVRIPTRYIHQFAKDVPSEERYAEYIARMAQHGVEPPTE